MKNHSSIFIEWRTLTLVVVFNVCALLAPAYCETDATALLLQQTPAESGTITPEVGVHHFAPNTYVTLNAVPRPGYQFIYWLGDVSDPTANSTIAYLDSPKIVIAVFGRLEYDAFSVGKGAFGVRGVTIGRGIARSSLVFSSSDYVRQGFSSSGRAKPKKLSVPGPTIVVIPEPGTVLLLGLGSLILLRKRRA